MRTARPVGLTDDGRFLIVETADGESLFVPADESRTTLRNRPRRHLETEMEQSMTPREIQMKIRAGASVEEIAEASGMPITRVEAFAAPVMAERNHIAGLAQLGSVRRTGEPTGHRTLRAAVSDRLRERGVDPDTVEWDAFKMDDGRWSVSAAYRIEQSDRVAVFYFDQRGRFSVSGNDEGRWAIGEQPIQQESAGSQTHVEDVDTEPTLKLASPADELALLRAVETDEPTPEPEPQTETVSESEIDAAAEVEELDIVPESPRAAEVEPKVEREVEPGVVPDVEDRDVAVPEDASETGAAVPEEPSQLDLLYDLLGSDGYAEDSIRVFEGLSDAAAVPEVADTAWQESQEEPDYPAEPAESESPESEPAESEPAEPEPADSQQAGVEPVEAEQQQSLPAGEVRPHIFADGATQEALPETEPPRQPELEAHPEAEPQPAPEVETEAATEPEPEAMSGQPEAVEPEAESKPAAKPKKRKRASVPSWDEIMFGSPTPKRK